MFPPVWQQYYSALDYWETHSPPAQQTRCWWWCSIFEEVLTKMMTDVTDVWAPLGCNNSKFSQIMCIICFIFHITQVKFLKLFLTLHTPVSSKKGKVFLVSHSDKVISELFGYQSRLLWYRWLCVRAHDVGWKKKENLVVKPEHWSSKCCWGIETSPGKKLLSHDLNWANYINRLVSKVSNAI